MKDYGREFKGSVWIQSVPTKPVWAAADERRVIYAEDENKVYVGGAADWEIYVSGETFNPFLLMGG